MSKYVLVAEDDTDIMNLVRDVLEEAGFTVGSAVGAETISAIYKRRPDLLLLDYQMPGMDGVRIAREVRANPTTADVPIIAMTAAGRVPTVCREMDAQGCLGKPFDIDNLVQVVDRLIHLTH